MPVPMPHLLHAARDLRVDEAAARDGVAEQRHEHGRQQVIRLADVGEVGEDARAEEVTVVGVVILDRVEDDRHAGELAPDRHRRLDAVHASGKLHVHEDGLRGLVSKAGLQRGLPAFARVQ